MSDSEEKEIRGSDEEHHDKNDMSDSESSKGSVSSSSSNTSSSSSSDNSHSSSVASKASKNASSAGEREEINKSDIDHPQSQNLLETSDDDESDEREESKSQLKEENDDQNYRSSFSSSDNSHSSPVASKASKNESSAAEREEINKNDIDYPQSQNLLETSDDDEPDEKEESKPQLKEENDDQNSLSQNLLASSDDDGSDGEDDRKPKFREAGEENDEDEPMAKRKATRPFNYENDGSKDPDDSAKLPQGVRPTDIADWDRLADTKWGREVLYKYMTQGESGVLVGLATTYANEDAKTEFPMVGEFPVHVDNGNPSFQDPEKINPLIGLPNDPMPPSYLHHIVRRALEAEEFDESLNHAFGDSAMVAIGMLVEEMVTASLLPLAGLHVLRCRELEDASPDEPIAANRQSSLHPVSGKVVQTLQPSNFRKEDNAFQEWTLPPEEALYKLYMDGRFKPDDFPTVLRPTCAIQRRSATQPRFRKDIGMIRQPQSLELESLIAANNFVYTHQLSKNLVKDNMDFFGLLLSVDPSPLDTRAWGVKQDIPVRTWTFPGSGSKTDTATSKAGGKKRKSGSTGAKSAKVGRAKTGQESKKQETKAAQILPEDGSETDSSDDVPLASFIARSSNDTATSKAAGKIRKSGSTGAKSANVGGANTGQESKKQKTKAAQILPEDGSETDSSDDVPLASLIARSSNV